MHKDEWKKVVKEDLRIIRIADKSHVIIKTPLPEDAYEEDGFFNDYYIYDWKTCKDYRAYMELEETDCGPPSIYYFDPRRFTYSINNVYIRLFFNHILPYIRVKIFNQEENKIITDRESSRTIMNSLDETPFTCRV